MQYALSRGVHRGLPTQAAVCPPPVELVALLGWWIGQRSSTATGDDRRLVADLSMDGQVSKIGVELSPNGRQVATMGTDSNGIGVIRLRDLSSDSAHIVPGSQGASGFAFSPDDKSLVFLGEGGSFRRMAVAGRPPTASLRRIC